MAPRFFFSEFLMQIFRCATVQGLQCPNCTAQVIPNMRYAFLFAAALLSTVPLLAFGQSSVLIHTGNGDCTYTTSSAIKSNATPGQLETTGTLTSGNCGSQSNLPVEFGPASQLAPSATTLPGTSGSVQYTFQPLHATQCTALFTGGNGSSTASFTGGNPLCSGTACNNLVTATANFNNGSTTDDANYSVNVTCTGLGAQAVGTATVVIPHTVQAGSCPTIASSTPTIAANFTRLTPIQQVNYFGSGYHNVDPTQFGSVYFVPWPGTYNAIADFSLPVNKYLSMQFTVPSGYMANAPSNLYGNIVPAESGYSAPVSITVSTSCGDFSDPSSYPSTSTVVTGCYSNKGGINTGIQWRKTGSCVLQDNQTYFLNVVLGDVGAVTPGGGGSAASTRNINKCSLSNCSVPVENGQGNWSTYVP